MAEGSYARAADRLGMSRAMASRHVSDLEAELGTKLLNRTTRQLSLTEAGQRLNAAAITIFELLTATEEEIHASTARPRGTLRVSAPMSFGVLHLARIVSGFLKTYPDIHMELHLDDRVVNIVEEGYDVAIRISTLADSTLVAKRLGPSRMVICASRQYLEAHGEPRNPADLQAHNCLVYEYFSRHDTWSFQSNGAREDVRVTGSLRGNNGNVLLQAAADGLGIALCPTFIAWEAIQSGQVEPILCDWSAIGRDFYAVMPPGRNNVLKVRAFIDYLASALGAEPYWDRELMSRHQLR